jgi:pimeloyl-ACP methyl ester carboxylesterase
VRQLPSTDGVTLALHDLGGRGPTIVYSHATGFHARVWLPLARRLANRYHGIAVDYRGHGDSTRPNTDAVDWHGYRDDALAVLDAIDTRPPLFGVGHSKGSTSLVMAELARPGTFSALALYEPIIFPVDELAASQEATRASALIAGTRRRRATFASFAVAEANYASKPPLDVLAADALHAYVEHGFVEHADGSVTLKCDPEHEARTFEGSQSHRTWYQLDQLTCPVLVMGGSIDDPGPAQVAEGVAERIRGSTFRRFEHLGHFGPLQDPDAIAAAIDEFFAARQ